MKKLTIPQLERKRGKIVRLRDTIRLEAQQGDLPGDVRMSLALASDALTGAIHNINDEITARRIGA